jgi:hypothetical protein
MNPGMNTPQSWNGLQRETANQAAMHNQSFAQAQNRPPSNPIAYGTNFTNPTNQQQPPPDFNSMQNRAPAINQMANTQSEQNAAIKENFMRFLQMQNVDGRVVVAGRSIELWELWHAVRKFNTQSGNHVRAHLLLSCPQKSYIISQANHPSKFHVIGAQLGLPTDQAGQLPWQYVKELQEQYTRVSIALQSARNTPQHPNPLPASIAAHQPALNATMLQSVSKAYPHIDFSGITPELVTNLPNQRFETRLRAYIAERGQPTGSSLLANPPHMPPRTPVPGQVVITNRNPTPVGNDPANNGQMSRQPNMPSALNVDEILRLHEQCQTVWRQTYDSLRKLSNQLYLYPAHNISQLCRRSRCPITYRSGKSVTNRRCRT